MGLLFLNEIIKLQNFSQEIWQSLITTTQIKKALYCP